MKVTIVVPVTCLHNQKHTFPSYSHFSYKLFLIFLFKLQTRCDLERRLCRQWSKNLSYAFSLKNEVFHLFILCVCHSAGLELCTEPQPRPTGPSATLIRIYRL